jgi:hypothetical protein
MIKKFVLHILTYSQIWLNLLMDDSDFGYVTKFIRKKHCHELGLVMIYVHMVSTGMSTYTPLQFLTLELNKACVKSP